MTGDAEQIRCIILTMRRENVILPGVNVAEIISVKNVNRVEDGPAWYLGELSWRGLEVPLLSFEAAAGEDVAAINLNSQAVVLHAATEADDPEPFVALIMSGVPHVTHFNRQQIVTDDSAPAEHPMVAQKVRINGARVSILDIDEIAAMAKRQHEAVA